MFLIKKNSKPKLVILSVGGEARTTAFQKAARKYSRSTYISKHVVVDGKLQSFGIMCFSAIFSVINQSREHKV